MPRTDGNLARADVAEDFAFGEPATTLDLIRGELASVAEILDAGRPEDAPALPLAVGRLLVLVAIATAAVGAALSAPTQFLFTRVLDLI
ncbi:MAG TPA: hypothetical protein VFR44_00275 [Actinomycetota bacterium]|nr:hypothetical protein [Actinomycetota bacterium]